jgi:hypothetical protein
MEEKRDEKCRVARRKQIRVAAVNIFPGISVEGRGKPANSERTSCSR